MIYKSLPADQGNRIIDWCEAQNVDFDIWNPEELLQGGETMEIGLSDVNWSRVIELHLCT